MTIRFKLVFHNLGNIDIKGEWKECLQVGLIYKEIQLDGLVELSVLLDFGNVQTMVSIKKRQWYFLVSSFAKNATNRHPLVAHVSVNFLEGSSSSSVRDNVEISFIIVSFFLFQMMKL